MDIAYASNGPAGGGFASFIPLLLMGCILGFFLKSIAKRKGRSEWLWFLAGFVPGWNLFGGIWLASLPDKSILEEIKALVNELQKFDFVPKGFQASSRSSEPQAWECNCGITNDINVPNCPECGLKRDYLLKHKKQGIS